MATTAASALRLRLGAGLPLVFDGGLASELQRRGFSPPALLGAAAALREAPSLVREIHDAYIAAGAHVIRANTARTTPRVLRRVGYEPRAAALTSRAVDLALESAQEAGSPVAVAGVLHPLEGRMGFAATPSNVVLEVEHAEQLQRLQVAGCDAIMIESMPTRREAVVATVAAAQTGLVVLTSLAVREDGRLPSGDELGPTIVAVQQAGAEVVLVNGCTVELGQRVSTALAMNTAAWGVLPDMTPGTSSRKLVAFAARMRARRACVVGGCCGSSPHEIGAIAREIAEDSSGDRAAAP